MGIAVKNWLAKRHVVFRRVSAWESMLNLSLDVQQQAGRPGLHRHARHQLTPRGLVQGLVGGRAGGVRAGGERVGARLAAGGAGEARARGARAGRRGSAGRGRLCVRDEARRGRRGEWSGWVGHIYRS